MFETYYTPRLTCQAMGAPNIGESSVCCVLAMLRELRCVVSYNLLSPACAAHCLAAPWLWLCLVARALSPIPFLAWHHLLADRNYYQCWVGLKSHFDPSWTPSKAAAAAQSATAGSKVPAGSAVEEAAVLEQQQQSQQRQPNGK